MVYPRLANIDTSKGENFPKTFLLNEIEMLRIFDVMLEILLRRVVNLCVTKDAYQRWSEPNGRSF